MLDSLRIYRIFEDEFLTLCQWLDFWSTCNLFMEKNADFNPGSRVWIYGASRFFSPEEKARVLEKIKQFTADWTSHQQQLKADAGVWFDSVLYFMVDESHAEVSGCGIDRSVKVVRELEAETGINLFNRLLVYVKDGETVKICSKNQVQELIDLGQIHSESLILNTLAQTKDELDMQMWIPIQKSWIWSKINQPV